MQQRHRSGQIHTDRLHPLAVAFIALAARQLPETERCRQQPTSQQRKQKGGNALSSRGLVAPGHFGKPEH
jgi:hypothetical protein